MNNCPDKYNDDPKRNEIYRKPLISRSEPLSNSEYLRKLKANGGVPLSSGSKVVQVGEGQYKKTMWTTAESRCFKGSNSVLPAVVAVHPGLHAKDASLVTEAKKRCVECAHAT